MTDEELGAIDLHGGLKEQLEAWDIFLESFGNLLPGGIGVYEYTEATVRPLYLSQGIKQLCYGFDEEFYEKSRNSIEYVLPEKEYCRLCKKVRESIENGTILDCTLRYYMTKKKSGWVWIRGKMVSRYEKRQIFICLILDVTKQKKIENELMIQSERYRLLEETSDEILFELDLIKDVLTYSYKEMDGGLIRKRVSHYTRMLQKEPLVHPDHMELFRNHLMRASGKKADGQMEYLSRISGHGFEWHRLCYNSIEDGSGNVTRIVGRIKNVHDEVLKRQRKKEVLAFGLQSYTGIRRRVQDILDNAELEDHHALVILCINHFKRIIEQNGVACGDAILHQTENIIQETAGESVVFGPLEDGRILLYFRNIPEEKLDETIHKIVFSIENSDYKVAGLNVACSIGAAMMQGAADYATFYQQVEEALHIAKITRGERYIRV